MAYSSYLTEDELKKKQDQGAADPMQAQAPAQGANQSGYVAPSQPSGTNTGAKPQTGTGWVNFDQYLTANKGKGLETAQNLISDNQQKIQKPNDLFSSANEGVRKGTLQGFGDQIIKDPTKIDPEAYRKYQLQAGYSGPTDSPTSQPYWQKILSDYTGAKNEIKGFAQGDGVGTALQNRYKEKGYTAGMGSLDNFLANSEGRDAFAAAEKSSQAFNPNFQELDKSFKSSVRNAQDSSQAVKEGDRNLVSTLRGKMMNDKSMELGAKGAGYGYQDVLSTEDFARMAALSNLAGESDPWGSYRGKPKTIGQMGSMGGPAMPMSAGSTPSIQPVTKVDPKDPYSVSVSQNQGTTIPKGGGVTDPGGAKDPYSGGAVIKGPPIAGGGVTDPGYTDYSSKIKVQSKPGGSVINPGYGAILNSWYVR